MTSLSLKDLVFLENGSVDIPAKSLAICTSSLEVSPAWLIQYVISQVAKTRHVLLVSFVDHSATHRRGLKRMGFDNSSHLDILDLSTKLYSVGQSFQPTSLDVLKSEIMAKIKPDNQTTLILESPDFLLASNHHEWSSLTTMITSLRKLSHNMYIFCNADTPLISGDTVVSRSQAQFLIQIMHSSYLSLSLRPLDTGRAEDVTGVLRVVRGPKIDQSVMVQESEYLYLVGDTTTKLFYR